MVGSEGMTDFRRSNKISRSTVVNVEEFHQQSGDDENKMTGAAIDALRVTPKITSLAITHIIRK